MVYLGARNDYGVPSEKDAEPKPPRQLEPLKRHRLVHSGVPVDVEDKGGQLQLSSCDLLVLHIFLVTSVK